MATLIIRPTSSLITSPDYQHWSNSRVPSVGVDSGWQLVDEVTADEDTTYFQCATTTHSFEFFGMGSTGATSGIITNVRLYFRCKHATATGYSRAIVGTLPTAGNYSYGANKTSTTSYQTFTEDFAVNPRTGVAWVWADFVNYYFGVEGWASAIKSNNRCTQFYVEITYTEPPTGLGINGMVATKINGLTPTAFNGLS